MTQKITVDTNFLVSATQWDYSFCHKLLIQFIEVGVEIFTTREILEEFFKVLVRDFKYSNKEANALIEVLLSFLNLIETTTNLEVIKEDPEDNKIIECAFESGSEFIITYDKHLLRLREYKKIKIIKPEDARIIFR